MFDACTKTLPSKSKFWKFYTNLLASPEFGIIKKVIIITKFSIILQTQAKMQRGEKTNLQPYSYLGLDLCVRMIHSQVRWSVPKTTPTTSPPLPNYPPRPPKLHIPGTRMSLQYRSVSLYNSFAAQYCSFWGNVLVMQGARAHKQESQWVSRIAARDAVF